MCHQLMLTAFKCRTCRRRCTLFTEEVSFNSFLTETMAKMKKSVIKMRPRKKGINSKKKSLKAALPLPGDLKFDASMEDDPMVNYGGSDDGSPEQEPSVETPPALTASKRKAAKAVPKGGAKTMSKKLKTTNPIKPPTLQEINELKETRNLFHSNLFRLQVKEMLKELQIKEKYKKHINAWLEQFKSFIGSLETASGREDADKMSWLEKSPLKVPLNLTKLNVVDKKTLEFRFIKPTTEPCLIGAAATGTLLGPKLVADVCVEMPVVCFQREDFLNLVYDQKRAFYLTYLAAAMLRNDAFAGVSADSIQFNYYENNPLKPVLEVTPITTDETHKLTIRVFVVAEETTFKLNRFVPWTNNIRPSLFGDADEKDDTPLPSTPHYNAGVLADLTLARNRKLMLATFDGQRNLQEGLVLLKVWLRQRQLGAGYSGFPAHILAMFIIYLHRQRKLHANMSSYQVARTVWNQLAFSAWDENGRGITMGGNDAPNQPTLAQFHDHYDVVFVDTTGFHNICSNVLLEVYRRVRLEAKAAVDILNDMQVNSFQLLFMARTPLYTQCDNFLKISTRDAIEQILYMHVTPAVRCDYAGYVYAQLLQVVTRLLQRGLSKRVNAILPIENLSQAWSIMQPPPGCGDYLHLGIVLNAEHAYEVLEKGPDSITPEAEAFRQFWGEKAQLRRFQDGSIAESAVWATADDTLSKKRLIVRQIVLHLLQHHLQLDLRDINYVGGELDVVYRLTSAFKVENLQERHPIVQDTDAEALSVTVIRSFDDLARKLHQLHELTLEVVSVGGISPVFRYCDPNPVLPEARFIQGQLHAKGVHRAVVQLGLSGKWPSELGALRALKSAFYLQIARQLRDKFRLRAQVSYEGVYVLKQGYCFLIELAHPKEVALLKRATTERGITQYVDCPASVALERKHYVMPQITGALHSLYQLYPSFGPAVMIAKRWLYAQLIDDGLWPDICTELLTASQYLRTCTAHITCSPQTGFVRFLHLLAHTDWRTELFVVNFNGAMTADAVTELEQRFNTERDAFPPLGIATAYDRQHSGQLWSTVERPSVQVLARVTVLARQSLAIIEGPLLAPAEEFVKPSRLFTPSSLGYDLVIQVKPELVPNTLCTEFSPAFGPLGRPNWRLPLANSNLMSNAIEKLRSAYSQFATFFYNPCGGKEIGVIWRPGAFDVKNFKVTECNGCTLTEAGSIQCNRKTLIKDFKIILKDFYLRIDTVEEVRRATHTAGSGGPAAKRYFSRGNQVKDKERHTRPLLKGVEETKKLR